jgi:hypothetical protein
LHGGRTLRLTVGRAVRRRSVGGPIRLAVRGSLRLAVNRPFRLAVNGPFRLAVGRAFRRPFRPWWALAAGFLDRGRKARDIEIGAVDFTTHRGEIDEVLLGDRLPACRNSAAAKI